MRVRSLDARDKQRWLELFRGYIAFYAATVPEDVIEATWRRMILRDPEFHVCLLAVDVTDMPVGLAHVLFHPSTWSSTWYCYLEDLFVDPDVRGKGIGRALIEAVYREADLRKCTRTYWVTQDSNATAQALYEKLATKSPFVQYRR